MHDHLGRRDFLRWMGAGAAMVSLPVVAGCRPGTLTGSGGPAPGAHTTYFDRFGADSSLLRRVLDRALSRNGDFADLYFEHTVSRWTGMRDGQVNRAFTGIDLGAGIRVLKGDATGFAYSEDLSEAALLAAADTAAAVADSGSRVRPGRLTAARTSDHYPVAMPWSEVGIDRILPIIERTESTIRQRDARFTKISVFVGSEDKHILLVNSDGLLVEDTLPMVTMALTCVASDNGKVESASDSISARHDISFLTGATIAKLIDDVVDQTLGGFEAVEAPSGEMPVVLGSGGTGVLLHEAIGHGMEADFNRKGISVYSDLIGQRIACPDVTIIDDGTQPHMPGSINVDDEGCPGQRTLLVEKGILRSYMHDRISARHYRLAPTGSGRRQSFRFPPVPRMRNTYMLSGPYDPQEIIASVERGIYASVIGNGEVNIGPGDFSFYAHQGRLIENGKLTHRIKDVNLTGNGPKVLESMDLIGKDLVMKNGGGSCGKDGQRVPVGFGMPTVRASAISVGGRTA